MSIVYSEQVMPKTFFLEAWNTPLVINSIRGIAVVIVLFLLIYYWRHRR